jgi:hypothetical protein
MTPETQAGMVSMVMPSDQNPNEAGVDEVCTPSILRKKKEDGGRVGKAGSALLRAVPKRKGLLLLS